MSEKYYISEILDEDLDVMEKWLIKVSIISEDDDNDEYILMNKVIVFDLITKLEKVEDYTNVLTLGYEVSKLPILYLTKEQQKTIKKYGIYMEKIK